MIVDRVSRTATEGGRGAAQRIARAPSPRPSPVGREREDRPAPSGGGGAVFSGRVVGVPSPIGWERVRVRETSRLICRARAAAAARLGCQDAASAPVGHATNSRSDSVGLRISPVDGSRPASPGCRAQRGSHPDWHHTDTSRDAHDRIHPTQPPAELRGSRSRGNTELRDAGAGICSRPIDGTAAGATSDARPKWIGDATPALGRCPPWCEQIGPETGFGNWLQSPSPRPSPIGWEREDRTAPLGGADTDFTGRVVGIPSPVGPACRSLLQWLAGCSQAGAGRRERVRVRGSVRVIFSFAHDH